MFPATPNAAEFRDWLRLARTDNVGPVTFRHLLRRFGTAHKALKALPELARRGGAPRSFIPPSPEKIDAEIAAMEKAGGHFLVAGAPDYPESLAVLDDAPPVLSVFGQSAVLRKRCIGIVGARNASLNGRKMAERLAHDLADEGFVIVSGLARGIDTAAHRASAAKGTVAVLAGGADVVYPEENRALYGHILQNGAIVSDQPLGSEPRAKLFPKRNRIIAGLSLGVVVVEAARQSGSLITARMALEQGREVFAVPGSPLDPRAQGTNGLLKQGAVLAESASDIIHHIYTMPKQRLQLFTGFAESETQEFETADESTARNIVLENLGPSPVALDDLIRQSGLSPALVLSILLELELAGRLERQPGQQIALIA